MITLQDFLEISGYRITEGSKFGWQCFGDQAWHLESWEDNRYSLSVVMDLETQVIYMAEAHDYGLDRSMRWINPEFEDVYRAEAERRQVDMDQSWDHVRFDNIDPDCWRERALALREGREYDYRDSVQLEFSDEDTLRLCLMAHEQDLTLNQFVERLLWQAIEQHETVPTVDAKPGRNKKKKGKS
jgi:hypothetical protein